MQKKRIYESIALVLFIVSTLLGCGSDDDNEDENGTDPTPMPSSSIVSFEGEFQSWADAATGTLNLIDFESVAGDQINSISGDEFNTFPGGPMFSSDETEIFIGNPSTDQTLTPVSGTNMFYPLCDPSCEGVVALSFDTAINAIGMYFIDVESDFASTGLSLSDTPNPDIAFSSNQGQNSQSFLGITREQPFTTVYIHFATGTSIDGSAIDDLSYVLAN